MKPNRPKALLSTFGHSLLSEISQDIETLVGDQLIHDEMREDIWKHVRRVQLLSHQIHFAFRIGDFDGTISMLTEGDKCLANILTKTGDIHALREGNVSNCVEKMAGARLLYKFFETGKLAGMEEVQPCRDDEYIAAVLNFSMDISKYCVGRATEGDAGSIELVKKLITQLNGKMLEFNFRNGPLRRKYDVLKYSLRNVENICYEYSLSKAFAETSVGTEAGVHDSHEMITNLAEDSLLDAASLDAIRTRMDAYDEIREDVIKRARDVQKLSKQAIFSVHRKDAKDAQQKLAQCIPILDYILIRVSEEPSLRYGAVSGCLEEWAEGMMTLQWSANKRILSKSELARLSAEEYVGALSDFTGEIGRLAVAAAAKRDVGTVSDILQADAVIYSALMQLNISGKSPSQIQA